MPLYEYGVQVRELRRPEVLDRVKKGPLRQPITKVLRRRHPFKVAGVLKLREERGQQSSESKDSESKGSDASSDSKASEQSSESRVETQGVGPKSYDSRALIRRAPRPSRSQERQAVHKTTRSSAHGTALQLQCLRYSRNGARGPPFRANPRWR